ncbi:MAG: hypothetical protein CBC55_02405 [Gammaproteobacteria bacterium TMED95]|uniref:Uncharacterized protein n=1 Tax=Alteromonas mediterranea TaxID=314275 RepID=A0AAC9NST1_9ALTE|nr:hypothetical protein [Alteromonas mediterranea]APD92040.1 hypothetical protein BM524_19155 [Alteromonas mediterranea]APD99894.1 hypothetical protein BM525_19350 [Alteromonas mediterranea]OUV22910.1 MAG: hypothetical protein CBC55_02405 [Gammaproteobacteria bacterium TMED95]|tara:strand:+ start:21143 stop:21913 length:771 start_codon:yes stop_codon:yes gene_type:complete
MKNASPLLLTDRLRAKTLDRFHIVDMANPGNVAEHSFGVQVIAEHLLVNIYQQKGTAFIDPIPPAEIGGSRPSLEERYFLMKYAQVHDLPELASSDIATPTKEYIRANQVSASALMALLKTQLGQSIQEEAYTTISAVLNENMSDFDSIMDKIETECLPELSSLERYFFENPHLKFIAKAADILEALSVFKTGRGLDHIQNERVEKKINESLTLLIRKAEVALPEFNWQCIALAREVILFGDSAINEFEETFRKRE